MNFLSAETIFQKREQQQKFQILELGYTHNRWNGLNDDVGRSEPLMNQMTSEPWESDKRSQPLIFLPGNIPDDFIKKQHINPPPSDDDLT